MNRLLLIAPKFYDYEIEIKKEIEKKGYSVEYISLKNENIYTLILVKLIQKIIKNFDEKYFNYIFKIFFKFKFQEKYFDKVLVISGETIFNKTLKLIKEKYLKNNGELILYIWTPINRYPNLLKTYKNYDKIFSFEKKDCKKYNFKFLPNFISNLAYKVKKNKSFNSEKYDIFFMGQYRKNRYELKKILNNINLKVDIRLYHNFISFIILYFFKYSEYKKIDLQDITFKKMNRKEMYERMLNSKAILDDSDVNQEGLTQRVLDSLILEKKVITTNKFVQNYEFYNPKNILIINKKNLNINKKILLNKYEKIDIEKINKYRLDTWVNYILGEENDSIY